MEFIKKNLWLVVGGAIGSVLLLIALVYLFLHIRQYRADTASADEQQERLTQLITRKPGPTEENVQLVSSNLVVLEGYQKKITEALRAGQLSPRKMQPVDFNSFLKSTVDHMKDAAGKRGLVLPAKFDFGFKTYYGEGRLPAVGDVPRLTLQVQMVRALMEMLRVSKVAEVVSVERQIFEKGVLSTPTVEGEEGERTGGVVAVPTLQEPPNAHGLYTRERFVLTLRIRDESIAGLLNVLGRGENNERQRLFTVVTRLDLMGGGLPKPSTAEAVAAAPAEGAEVVAGEKSAEPKKREERIIAGADNVTVRLDVDVYRFTDEAGEKAKP